MSILLRPHAYYNFSVHQFFNSEQYFPLFRCLFWLRVGLLLFNWRISALRAFEVIREKKMVLVEEVIPVSRWKRCRAWINYVKTFQTPLLKQSSNVESKCMIGFLIRANFINTLLDHLTFIWIVLYCNAFKVQTRITVANDEMNSRKWPTNRPLRQSRSRNVDETIPVYPLNDRKRSETND